MSWQREYRSTVSTFVYVFLGFVFLFMGLIFTFLMGALGLAVLSLAIIVPGVVRYLRRDLKVTCGAQGFVVRTESARHGLSEVAHAWEEVTATNYYETAHRDTEGFSHSVGHFEVETVGGKAFAVNHKVRGFGDLVETFNIMAPQIPYMWKPRKGFTLSVGPATISRGAYLCVDREEAQQRS